MFSCVSVLCPSALERGVEVRREGFRALRDLGAEDRGAAGEREQRGAGLRGRGSVLCCCVVSVSQAEGTTSRKNPNKQQPPPLESARDAPQQLLQQRQQRTHRASTACCPFLPSISLSFTRVRAWTSEPVGDMALPMTPRDSPNS